MQKQHITPILSQFHWLPIQKLICHKIFSDTYRSVHDNPPSTSLIFSINTPLPRLSSRSLLHVPRPRDFNTKRYGHQAFRYVAPSVWNGPEGRPWMFDVTLLSGISRLSFESPFLSPLFSLSLCLSLSVSSSVSVCLSVSLSLSLASFFLSSFSA